MTALELAELDLLLGSRLHTALGRRIRAEVERRCLAPYLTRHDRWWLHGSGGRSLNNWTAVCNAGVAGAALYSSGTRAGWRRSWRGRFARYDSHFVQTGVSFFASSGDNGTPASYPSASPNIISVGGTTLSFSNGVLTAETGWSGSGGG
ncbi:MAG TPA: hypothetical protein VFA49_13560, partial [Chloroflexota bacterium]|nr:hypothetical protein [Chloroflexota bacterium]